ncbi:MAG: hypothetical protein N2044_12295, partial [Cyclobacteriaceae bacterium]|nr:hypothetical protein [Cyclobacteriaceae bacterium]
MKWSAVYGKLPVLLQNMVVSAYGFYWKKRRYGGIFDLELKKFKARETFSSEDWKKYLEKELRRLLVHAFDTVEFYNQSFLLAGFKRHHLEKIKLENLSELPFLSKSDLRKEGKRHLLSRVREKGGSFFSSSGSTGTPTEILFSFSMHQRWSAAFEARIRNWAGVNKNMARGMIGGRRVVAEGKAKPPYYRYNFFEKQTYFSAYHISPATISDYAEGMFKHKVRYMTGYAMSNYILAKFARQAKIRLPQMKAVITSSEKLTPEMRELFYEVYHCKTFDSWSGVEACGLVSECEFGSLHVSPDVGILEILNDRGVHAEPGEIGEVVCTGLLNYDQPLIR